MNIVSVNAENLEKEHICCAISASKDDCQAASKKAWMKERFADGLVFLKGDVRGKCFIEYIPAEKAWAPVAADGWAYIDCLWVSGQFKGQGNSSLLLDSCIEDCRRKGMKGLVMLSADKKRPFLSDPGFLAHKGFTECDSAEPFYRLYCLAFDENAEKPHFCAQVKKPCCEGEGFTLYYTHQCPYTAKYVPEVEKTAADNGIPFAAHLIDSLEKAKAAPAPFTSYSLFYNGKFVTNEIQNEKRFLKLNEGLK